LRAIPNLQVMRPADTIETAECWALALAAAETPSVLVLTRQALPAVRAIHSRENLCARGAYVLSEATGPRRVTLIATGSEVPIALDARAKLAGEGIEAGVVSMPCWSLFEAQPQSYREQVLGAGTVRVAVEAATGFGWERWIGDGGGFVGMKSFGASAPAGDLYKHFGITADAVVTAVKARLG
jgi:transketolase